MMASKQTCHVTYMCRLSLLRCRSSSERLRKELELLQALGTIRCRACHARLAEAGDALAMTEEGIGSAFVNPQG